MGDVLPKAEIYRREAERLRSMADAFIYHDVREEFLQIAQRYDILARQSERMDRQLDAANDLNGEAERKHG